MHRRYRSEYRRGSILTDEEYEEYIDELEEEQEEESPRRKGVIEVPEWLGR
jgi:hypothetical protein